MPVGRSFLIGRVALIVGGVLCGGLLLICLPFVFASAWLRDIPGWHPEEQWSDEPLRYFTPIEGVPDWLLGDWQVILKQSRSGPCPPNGGYRFTTDGLEKFTHLRQSDRPHESVSFGPGPRDLTLNSVVMRAASSGFVDTLMVGDPHHWVPPESEAQLMRDVAKAQGLPEDALVNHVMPRTDRAHEFALKRCG
jgi:hypothetical protein